MQLVDQDNWCLSYMFCALLEWVCTYFFQLLPLMKLGLLPFLYWLVPHCVIFSLGNIHSREGITATSRTHSCGIGDLCFMMCHSFLLIVSLPEHIHTICFPLTILCKEVLRAITRLKLHFSNNAEYCWVTSCLKVSLLAIISFFGIILKSYMKLRQAIGSQLCPSGKFHGGMSFMTIVAPIRHQIMLT